jgi:putative exosortase-associated protein (TIGR04073 family)
MAWFVGKCPVAMLSGNKNRRCIMILHKVSGIIALAVGLLMAAPVMAGDYAADSGAKFTRGLANTATGWGEIPKNIVNESRDHNALVGLTYGTVKGAVHTIGRTAVGAFDLVTFFAPTEEAVHSTYVWENQRDETTYGIN